MPTIIRSAASGKKIYKHRSCDLKKVLKAIQAEDVSLAGADFTGADFGDVDLSGLDLTDAVFKDAYLVGTDFRWSRLIDAKFLGCEVDRAHFAGARLDRAQFQQTNVVMARLWEASFWDTLLDGEALFAPPLAVIGLEWPVLITGQYMRIGCKRFLHAEWTQFSDTQIASMEPWSTMPLPFWRAWKAPLMKMCARKAADAIREYSAAKKTAAPQTQVV